MKNWLKMKSNLKKWWSLGSREVSFFEPGLDTEIMTVDTDKR